MSIIADMQHGCPSPDPIFIQNGQISSTKKRYTSRSQRNKVRKNLTSVFESENILNMVTSTIDDLDVSEIDIHEDSDPEYIPDSENSSDEETDDGSIFQLAKHLRPSLHDKLYQNQNENASSTYVSSSDSSLEIPVSAS